MPLLEHAEAVLMGSDFQWRQFRFSMAPYSPPSRWGRGEGGGVVPHGPPHPVRWPCAARCAGPAAAADLVRVLLLACRRGGLVEPVHAGRLRRGLGVRRPLQ